MVKTEFVAVDWGTSSFRLWVMNPQGQVSAEHRGALGMATLAPGEFSGVLETQLQELEIATETPIIICGMAGAAQGWCEAVYVTIPSPLSGIALQAITPPDTRRDVRILPGAATDLKSAPDVMRGEETLLMGAYLNGVNGTICLPGTHSKWAILEQDVLKHFATAFTGELFAILQRDSTLSSYLTEDSQATRQDDAFRSAVTRALANPASVLQEIFSIRAAGLRHGTANEVSRACLSGFLIGVEIAGMRERFSGTVTLVASEPLRSWYSIALKCAGFDVRHLGAEAAVQAGLHWAAATIWPASDSLIKLNQKLNQKLN